MNATKHQFIRACGLAVSLVAALGAADLSSDSRIADLRQQIARHDDAYHRRAAPEITDVEYDQLKRKLAALEQEFPDAAQRVPPLAALADDRTGTLPTGRHRERMLSLDKVYRESELRAFDAKLARSLGRDDIAYTIEPKFDGLAVSVTYVRGQYVRALTRGNGVEGDDVTANVAELPHLPRTLALSDPPAVIEVRGEVYVPWNEFARVNMAREAAGEPRFANPRNLAAGTLRQRESRLIRERGLQVTFFGVGACDPVTALPATQRELLAQYQAWGLPVSGEAWSARGAEELLRAVQACEKARPRFPFPTDGAVVKLDALATQRDLGAGESAPRWAVAYKFPPERAETQVLAITLQVGRTGVLTPVAELAPVRLAGTSVARATLHNRDLIAREDIRVGDWVFVEKAGEIIPAIVGVNRERRVAAAKPFAFPANCPECGAPVVSQPEEAAVRCVNRGCAAQLRRRIEHYASRESVAIEGLGPAMIEALVAKGFVRDLPDLYRLKRADLLTLERASERTADRLLGAIERSKHAELWRVINGLGLPQVGAAAAKQLARRHANLRAFAETQPEHRALIEALIAVGVEPMPPPKAGAQLAGKNFVLTGTLPSLTRAEATRKIESAGGKVASSVTRATHYVVVGADPGAKLEQAKKLGVTVLDEAALLRILAED